MKVSCGALLLLAASVSEGLVTDLRAAGENSIRVRVAPNGGVLAEPVKSALLPNASQHLETRRLSSNASSAVNGNLRVDIDETTGYLTATRVSDGLQVLKTTLLAFGAPVPPSATGTYYVNATFATPASATERIYGLGEHYGLGVNVFPYFKKFADSLFYPASHGSDVSIPWYCSSHGYGFVWNNPSLGTVNITNGSAEWTGLAVRNFDVWITVSPQQPSASFYRDLLKQYVDATGHALPMPGYTTGFIQSKDRYRNQTQLLDVAREYVSRSLPISMIVIDWFHWKEMGDWSLNPICWPDPQAMMDELRELGIELMITCWPFVGINVSVHWDEFSQNKWLALNSTSGTPDSFWRYNTPTGNPVVDSTNPAAMAGVMKAWWTGYGQYGVRAVWMDEAEPDHTAYISGGQWSFNAGSDSEVLPAWVKYWTEGFRTGLEEKYEPGEFFILSRNAWAGTASDGAALWSGDISSSWTALQQSVVVAQQVAMSGIPLWTTDIGGYTGGDPTSADFQQMVVRWFQFGAFCPLFRLHGHRDGGPPGDECGATNGDNEVWNLAPSQTHYDAIVAVMNLREQLRPYVLEANKIAVATGYPMLRPVFLEYPADDNLYTIETQFMLGSDWLISPVTAANATTWPAYLPELPTGLEWVYWWNQTVVAETGWVTVSVESLADFPLFYRRPSANMTSA
ncbi:alpha-D-xyloside xylohydrolase [Diplonema papillatum]|nr:alpha-D-xyloside xylohydrolase [Diplonema papillatum]